MAPRKAVPAIQEFAFIRALAHRVGPRPSDLIQGIGDDAAVIASPPGTWWHLTTDLLAEGIHFDLQTASLWSVGYRAAIANLSDIAAMGATPRYILTSLAVPKQLKRSHLDEFYRGLMSACQTHQVTLIGGDTSASKAGLFLSITLIGTTTGRRALFRHGATAGDRIYVTGTLGDSLAGLQLLNPTHTRASRKMKSRLSQPARQFLIGRHLQPSARVAEGQWLSTSRMATAAIDLSDGLSGDLRHICEDSHVGAEVELTALPISPACQAYASACGVLPTQLALTGGEDYELLFTASPNKHRIIERQARARGYQITCIGTIRPARFGIQMIMEGRRQPMPMTSYEHFR